MNNNHEINLNNYLKKKNKINKKGECVHFNCGDECNEIINAHSVQKSNMLESISKEGKVYSFTKNALSNIRSNHGHQVLSLDGIRKASVFRGFCKFHDNEIFQAIDNNYFDSSEKHVVLYAYRCFCKEYFTKKKTIESINSDPNVRSNKLVERMLFGFKKSLDDLNVHKEKFEFPIRSENYKGFKFISFFFNEPSIIAYSGITYPTHDFEGKVIQDLLKNDLLGLLTFFSSITDNGWAHTFCWHESSDFAVNPLINTLVDRIRLGDSISDIIFRFVVSSCENTFFSPRWYESLNERKKSMISARVNIMGDPTQSCPDNYLSEGLEGILQCKNPYVIDNLFSKVS